MARLETATRGTAGTVTVITGALCLAAEQLLLPPPTLMFLLEALVTQTLCTLSGTGSSTATPHLKPRAGSGPHPAKHSH